MSYILHHVPGSRSVRVLWLMEEMGLNYDIRARGREELRAADYLALNPLGTVPMLETENGPLLESGAILQYLLAKHAPTPLSPAPSDPTFGQYLQWLHFCEGTLSPWVLQYLVNSSLKPEAERDEKVALEARGRVQSMLDYMSWTLDVRDYLGAPHFTAADIMVGHTLYLAGQFGLLDQAPPSVRAYVERVTARPAFGRAVAG